MSQEEFFRDLVSGNKTGVGASLLRGLLRCVEGGYACVTKIRNRLYDSGSLRSGRLDVPVVSVGNLTLGGTGKTPMIAHLTQSLLQQGLRVGIVSRGYGARAAGSSLRVPVSEGGTPQFLNDEGMELALRFPEVPQEQSPDRLGASRKLLRTRPVDVILLDDAFQHRRIARDRDIVLLDSRNPFGYDHVFPRGLLRESICSLARARIVLLSRADLVAREKRDEIRNVVRTLAPEAIWGEIAHRPVSLVSHFESSEDEAIICETKSDSDTSVFFAQRNCSLSWLKHRNVTAFSGIAQPPLFFGMLRQCGANVNGTLSFPDHHRFTKHDLCRIAAQAERHRSEAVLCTMKDLVKIPRRRLGAFPLWSLAVGIEFLYGQEEFDRDIARIVRPGERRCYDEEVS